MAMAQRLYAGSSIDRPRAKQSSGFCFDERRRDGHSLIDAEAACRETVALLDAGPQTVVFITDGRVL